ncbi:MAG: RNA polymerase sigma factor [Ignavibacteriae bacterium]|nr:RNA polymerase sigma factor [Ignavibacteriota bacterium]
MTDEEIIDQYLLGNRKAFTLITDWIRAVVYRRTWMDGLSIDDIVSETRIKVYLNLQAGKFRFDAPLKAYVQRITEYTVIDEVRISERAARYVAAQGHVPQEGGDALDELIKKDDLALLVRILQMLDESCRAVWELILHEEVPYKEIARRMKMTEGAARLKAFRCKEEAIALRKKLS